MKMKRLLAMLMATAVSFTVVPAQGVFAAEQLSTDEEGTLVEDAAEVETGAMGVEPASEDEIFLANEDVDESYEVNSDDDDDVDLEDIEVQKKELYVGDYSKVDCLNWVLDDDDVDTDKVVWSIDKPNIAKITNTAFRKQPHRTNQAAVGISQT